MAPTSTTASKLRDYYVLTKPEVNLLVVMTTAAGYHLGCPGPLHAIRLIHTLSGTLLVASGTATLNQWMEQIWDGRMRRTANRPLPSGRLGSREALLFGIMLSIAGGLYLAIAVNWMSSILALSTLLSYLLIYTPLKRRTPVCTLLGAIPGAMPALIGCAGASPRLCSQAWFLFGLLFVWQFPHFLAIALMYREDYARAGYKMLPAFDADSRFTRTEILGSAIILVIGTVYLAHGAGTGSLITTAIAGGILYPVISLVKSNSRGAAKRVVHASVIYLPILLAAEMISKAQLA